MGTKQKSILNTKSLLASLRKKSASSEKRLHRHHPQAAKFFKSVGLKPGKIRQHAAKIAAAGTLTGSLLLSSPTTVSLLPLPPITRSVPQTTGQLHNSLIQNFTTILPKKPQPLNQEQEEKISQLLKETWDINSTAQLYGERLNRSYGLIGAEQHLPRYPGDRVSYHNQYQKSGITPGKGAWGYFSSSKAKLTNDLVQKEKYYVAVQTLYLPDWNQRFKYLRDWYQYRKVVVVNPINGKTIICDIADSGPANWTGKHFGGSPEVMAYLDLNTGKQKGPVVLFFVDDKQNRIPLGPLEYNLSLGPAKVPETTT